MGIPVGVSKTEYGMDMWTVMNPHGPAGILWSFRMDVRLSGNASNKSLCFNFAKCSPVCNLFYGHLSSRSLLNTHTITRLRVQHKYAYLKMHLTKRHRVWVCRISGFCWYGDSLGGISTGLSVGMGLKSNPNGSPDKSGWLFHAVDVWWIRSGRREDLVVEQVRASTHDVCPAARYLPTVDWTPLRPSDFAEHASQQAQIQTSTIEHAVIHDTTRYEMLF